MSHLPAFDGATAGQSQWIAALNQRLTLLEDKIRELTGIATIGLTEEEQRIVATNPRALQSILQRRAKGGGTTTATTDTALLRSEPAILGAGVRVPTAKAASAPVTLRQLKKSAASVSGFVGLTGNDDITGVKQFTHLALDRTSATLVNGQNNNVPTSSSYLRLRGPTGAYSVSGFDPVGLGASAKDGLFLLVQNDTNQFCTFLHSNSGSSAPNRIFAPANANLTVRLGSTIFFIYDVGWHLAGVG